MTRLGSAREISGAVTGRRSGFPARAIHPRGPVRPTWAVPGGDASDHDWGIGNGGLGPARGGGE